ncbi:MULTISPECIES: hypothetical protein [Nguyenibacter]|uniref:Uncharacterized protein n=1 Tax=Nguyenibacter vanlangensis TaxID=1216886 RepID=A0A7Y7ITE8_9PROT|nr:MULTISPECIES: hypothetical protein [Nguyenibacter]NVN10034.1 hypothetical protein [Nguyenibacter vanlangensis]WRH87670.1 hypothetical protein QN315_17175 [Nguyenibacter sp. L1]
MATSMTPKAGAPSISNVVPLRASFLPRHREYLMRWLEAGSCMGLCDIDVSSRSENGAIEHVLIWVRENADPAYLLRPEGMKWVLIDNLRDHRLGAYQRFEAALYAIRPVLPCGATVAA